MARRMNLQIKGGGASGARGILPVGLFFAGACGDSGVHGGEWERVRGPSPPAKPATAPIAHRPRVHLHPGQQGSNQGHQQPPRERWLPSVRSIAIRRGPPRAALSRKRHGRLLFISEAYDLILVLFSIDAAHKTRYVQVRPGRVLRFELAFETSSSVIGRHTRFLEFLRAAPQVADERPLLRY